MTQAEQISQAIATVERQISEAKSETAKKVLAKKLERLKDDLKKTKPSLTTLSKARKTVKGLNKSAFQELVEELSKKPEYAFLKSYSQERFLRDKARTAKPKGYRFKGDNDNIPTADQVKKGLKDGTVYYEGRPIRSDVSREIRLKTGGEVGSRKYSASELKKISEEYLKKNNIQNIYFRVSDTSLENFESYSIEPSPVTDSKNKHLAGMQILWDSRTPEFEVSEYQAGKNGDELWVYGTYKTLTSAIKSLLKGNSETGRKRHPMYDEYGISSDYYESKQNKMAKGGNIQFRKLAKSNNFDIIVSEGRFEVELDSNNKVKSIVHPSGERHKASECSIYQKYKKEINSYLTERFAEGGGVDNKGVQKGYNVFNYTDNIYATDKVFKTKKEANDFIKEFRNRFSKQGYYRDNQMNKIDIEDIDLLAIPVDFSPFRKFEEGGNIDSSYLGTTRIGKGHYGWTAKTTTKKQINGYDWEITTMKRSSGDLVSSANGGKAEQKEGYSTFMYSPFEDTSLRLISSKPKMVNEKAVTKQHEEALKIFIEKLNEMKGDKMATGGGIEAPKYFKNGGQTYTWLNVTKMKSLIRFNNKKEAEQAKKILNNLNDEFTYHLVEEGDKFVIYRDSSKDEFLLNIINSIGTDAEWVNVSSMKKEGTFESELEARKKFEKLWDEGSKIYYLLSDSGKNTFYVYSEPKKSDKVLKEIMATGGKVGEKTYNVMHNVGKAKYVVNFHNGEKTYSDGSPFFDIEIFKNLKGIKAFTKKLESEGYKKQMATGGKLEYTYVPNQDISKIVLKSKQVIGKNRILDGAYVKGGKQTTKSVEKFSFAVGSVVWDKTHKRYGVVLNNFGNEFEGDGGEIRLDSDGVQPIFEYDKKFNRTDKYNLVPYGSREDKGNGDLTDIKESGQRLIDGRKERGDEEYVKYYQDAYGDVIAGKIDGKPFKVNSEKVIGETSTGKSIYQKYTSIPDLSYEELKEASDIHKKFSKKAKTEAEKETALKYSREFMRMANEEKFAKGLGKFATSGSKPNKNTSNHGKFGDDNPRLVNFDIDDLNPYEEMVYNDMKRNNTKASTLQVIINTVEGDYTQLSPKLAEIAEEQFTSDEWDEESNKRYFAEGGNIDDSVEELWRGYASAILFAETDYETEEPLDYNYSISDFDEETEKDSKKLLTKFYTENKKAIEESGLDLDTIGNDIWYTRAGHGAGFFDHNLDSDVEEALTSGAKALGEHPDVEVYDGKISVRGGRVFEYKRGGKITKEDALQEAIAMGVDFNKDFHAQSFGNELSELAKKVGYRKSPSSSGSTGRAFFYHLQKIYDKKKFATGGGVKEGKRIYEISVPYNFENVVEDNFKFTEFLSKTLTKKWFGNGVWEVKVVKQLFENNYSQKVVVEISVPYNFENVVEDNFKFTEFLSKILTKKWFGNGIWGVNKVSSYATGGSVSSYFDDMTESEILKATVVYDNGGETIDRYTVFTPDGSVFGMSENPTRAFNGFNQYIGDDSEIEKGSHLGKRLKTVPKGIKSAVLDRMKEEFADGGMTYAGGGSVNSKYYTLWSDEEETIKTDFDNYEDALSDFKQFENSDQEIELYEIVGGKSKLLKRNSTSNNTTYIKLSNSEVVLELEKRDGKWVEGSVLEGEEPYGWGGKTYMGYLKPNNIVNWLNKDYKSNFQIIEQYAHGGSMYAGGGNTNYSYIEKDKIDRIVTNSGKEYGSNVILDGAYVTDRVRTPKMSRTQFEDETYSFGHGGNMQDFEPKSEDMRATILAIQRSRINPADVSPNFAKEVAMDIGRTITDKEAVRIAKGFGYEGKYATGGTVGDYFYDTRKDKAFQVIMEDGDKMAIQYLDRSKSPIGKAETISKNEFEYYVQMGAWNKWKQEYATGGEITPEEREQGLKNYPKLNF